MSEAAAPPRTRRFNPADIVAVIAVLLSGNIVLPNLVVIPVGAIIVLTWRALTHTSWPEIGYVRPRHWPLSLFISIAGGAALKVLLKSIVMPILGADAVNHAYHFLAGNRALLPNAIVAMCVVGFAEETIFRGFLFGQLAKLVKSQTVIVAITSLLFGAAHYASQGASGVEQAIITGLVFGTAYARTRSLYPVMIAHAAFDLTALAMIYFDVEAQFAHALTPH